MIKYLKSVAYVCVRRLESVPISKQFFNLLKISMFSGLVMGKSNPGDYVKIEGASLLHAPGKVCCKT